MKKTAAKLLPLAALVALGALALPAARAQDFGDLLGKAQDAVDKAKDGVNKANDNVNKAKDGANKARGGRDKAGEGGASSGPRKDGRPSGPTASRSGAQPLVVEKQVTAALRGIAPKGTMVLVVSCKVDPTGTGFTYTSSYVAKSAGRAQAASLPAIPASVRAQFVALREAWRQTNYENRAWEVCRVTVPFGMKQTFGDENDGQFAYGYKEQRGEKSNDSAYKMVTPAQLMAMLHIATTNVARDRREQRASQAEMAKLKREHEAAIRAGGKDAIYHWTCSLCGETADSTAEPNAYLNGGCEGTPSRRHQWTTSP